MRIVVVCLAVAGIVGAAAASSGAAPLKGDKTLSIASDLGVGLDELVACRNDARGKVSAERGTVERRDAIQAIVLGCLQQTRPDLAAAKFDGVMAKYR